MTDHVSEAALLALRAIALDGMSPDSYQIRGSSAILPQSEAAAELASMVKPVLCTGNVAQRVLVIDCSPLTPPRTQPELNELFKDTFETLLLESSQAGTATVLLRSGREKTDSLTLTFAEVYRWLTEYKHVGFDLSYWSPGERATTAVIEIWPAGPTYLVPSDSVRHT
ncbi:MAG: hypothetical protein ACREMY_16825 [bacterium]